MAKNSFTVLLGMLQNAKDTIFSLCILCLSRLATEQQSKKTRTVNVGFALKKQKQMCCSFFTWNQFRLVMVIELLISVFPGTCAANTRVIKQSSLQKFQEEMDAVKKDPYRVVMRQSKLPMSLLHDRIKAHVCMPISEQLFTACVGDTAIAALHTAVYFIV